MAEKLPKTAVDESKLFLRPRTPADATKCKLAKTVQFRRVGWCAEGIMPLCHVPHLFIYRKLGSNER